MCKTKTNKKDMETFAVSLLLLYDFLICIMRPKPRGKDLKSNLEDGSLVL